MRDDDVIRLGGVHRPKLNRPRWQPWRIGTGQIGQQQPPGLLAGGGRKHKAPRSARANRAHDTLYIPGVLNVVAYHRSWGVFYFKGGTLIRLVQRRVILKPEVAPVRVPAVRLGGDNAVVGHPEIVLGHISRGHHPKPNPHIAAGCKVRRLKRHPKPSRLVPREHYRARVALRISGRID